MSDTVLSGAVACLTRDVRGTSNSGQVGEKLTVTLRLLPWAEILVIRHESDALFLGEGGGSVSAGHARGGCEDPRGGAVSTNKTLFAVVHPAGFRRCDRIDLWWLVAIGGDLERSESSEKVFG